MSEKIIKRDAVIVGAGFAGLYMTKRLIDDGLSAITIDMAKDIGGTWFWNRYPGARCDIESVEYSYQFSDEVQQEWVWTERYASQPEILSYINFVADKFSLRKYIQLNRRVESAVFDQENCGWSITLSTQEVILCRYLVLAVGNLSAPFVPSIDGHSKFSGVSCHTARWPSSDIDLVGKKVGVIGTGSSGVQCIPLIAEQASQLFVFQRTPAFTIPSRNKSIDEKWLSNFKLYYPEFRAKNSAMLGGFSSTFPPNEQSALSISKKERLEIYEKRWNEIGGLLFMQSFNDLLLSNDANKTAGDFIRSKIKKIVNDPKTAEMLSPKGTVGCKRLCVDAGYYETYNRPNVHLIDISGADGLKMFEAGINYGDEEYPLDIIVFATGFDAITGSILKMNIIGKDGIMLSDKWKAEPNSMLGALTHGFPNIFMICGPGNPSVLTNMVATIEHHADWIADCIRHSESNGYSLIECAEEAERDWMKEANRRVTGTLFYSCNSWYLGANIPGKPRQFIPYLGFADYVARAQEISNSGYPGVCFS